MVAGRLEAPEGREGLPPRLRRRDAVRTPRFGLERDVLPQFVVQLAVDAIAVEDHSQRTRHALEPSLERHGFDGLVTPMVASPVPSVTVYLWHHSSR